ncbi:MAG: type VI secretion system lipoprotein TssJ [Pseudomonadota bacterium]
MLAVAGCQPAPAAVLSVTANGTAGMNPGPDGTDRPLTLTIIQMGGTGGFDGADFFALQDPQTALGGDFLGAQQLTLGAGSSAATQVSIQPTAIAVGFVAGFRDPGGKVFRRRLPAPSGPASAVVTVTSSGLTVQSA